MAYLLPKNGQWRNVQVVYITLTRPVRVTQGSAMRPTLWSVIGPR